MKRFGFICVLGGALTAACAQILSYDDYSERGADSSIDDTRATETTTVTDTSDSGPTIARPPGRPTGEAKPSGKGKTLWLALKHMYVGTTDSFGKTSAEGWKEWGFDLDNVCTSLEDSIGNVGTCRRPVEAKQDFLLDGYGCRDNNFGRHVVALLNLSSDGFETRLNEGLLQGNSTWIIRLDDVDDGADDAYAPAKLYRADGSKSAGFKWDGTDVRKVLTDSLRERDLEKPSAEFLGGYLRGNVWVSGEPELKTIALPLSASTFAPLVLEAARISLVLDAAHKNGTKGVIAGALPVKTIDSLLAPVAKSSGFCPETSLYKSLLRSVQRFPDVVIGAPNLQNLAVECDGISLGLGFDVAPIQPVTELVDPPRSEPDPCTDGGVDSDPPDTGSGDTSISDARSDAKTDGG